jgi:hypothetical protein
MPKKTLQRLQIQAKERILVWSHEDAGASNRSIPTLERWNDVK